ncbi:ALQxL family class IV lanthipeptide [Nonomuraea sp. NPDC050451]
MTTDVAALQELTAQEGDDVQVNAVCCITWTIPGCGMSWVST